MGIDINTILDPRQRARFEEALGAAAQPKGSAGEAALKNPAGGPSGPVAASVTVRPPLDPESKLHDHILEYVHSRGWLAVHSRMDRRTTTAKGVSDFIIITPKTVYFIECKRKGGKLTKEQQAFLTAIRVLGWPEAVVYSTAEFDAFMAGKS
jgi:hypothetical protein